ncbi:MAG TPA: hypothetical protein VH137_05560 [Gemmatimonadales bacterium]|nr:hypothetical protein [Gemmatimonadales bacterium]
MRFAASGTAVGQPGAHAAPPVPQALGWHVWFASQQPPGQLSALHTQRPPMQVWVAAHETSHDPQ